MTTTVNYASEASMTTLTREKIEALREAARKATPAPWHAEDGGDAFVVVGSPTWPCTRNGEPGKWAVAKLDDMIGEHAEEEYWNAEHIANCDPATILSLCDMAEAGQTDRVGELVKALNIIDALDPEEHVYGVSHDACRGLIIRMGEIARTALSNAQEDGK